MAVQIYAKNYRGFSEFSFTLDRNLFLVGDNSTGKSSILQLISYIFRTDLDSFELYNDAFGDRRFDFFSPYCEFGDVTIGYSIVSEKKIAGRLITIKKGKNDEPPILTKLTIWDSLEVVVIKISKKRILIKNVPYSETPTFDELLQKHYSEAGFSILTESESEIKFDRVGKYILFCFKDDKETKNSSLMLEAVFGTNLPEIHESGPIRAKGGKYYFQNRAMKKTGSHFVQVLHDFKVASNTKLVTIMENFGKNGNLFEKFVVKKIAKQYYDSPLVVSVWRHGREFSLEQVGVGVSQSVPVLVEAVLALKMYEASARDEDENVFKNAFAILQQPELHLHPKAQAEMGEAIFEFSKIGLRLFVETHSDYLIDRYRACLRENSDFTELCNASILFFENSHTGNKLTELEILGDGSLKNTPENYKDFFINELSRTIF